MKLCAPGTHKNVIAVFRVGQILTTLFHFIDMERCAFNLEKHILSLHRKASKPERGTISHTESSEHEKILFTVQEVMIDITSGVSFIHSHKQIHRDLKPRNGNFY